MSNKTTITKFCIEAHIGRSTYYRFLRGEPVHSTTASRIEEAAHRLNYQPILQLQSNNNE